MLPSGGVRMYLKTWKKGVKEKNTLTFSNVFRNLFDILYPTEKGLDAIYPHR